MGYIYKEITSNNTENNFLKLFCNSLIEDSGGRIVYAGENLASDIDTMITKKSGSINFYLFLNSLQTSSLQQGYCTLSISRGLTASSSQNNLTNYLFSCAKSRSSQVKVNNETPAFSTATTRTLKYMLFTNSQVFYIRFGDYSKQLLSSNTKSDLEIILLKENALKYCSTAIADGSGNPALFDSGVYVCDAPYANTNNTYIAINKLPFRNSEENLTQLQIIHNKTFINENTQQKILHFGGLYDCSITNPQTFMKNGSHLYYTINANTLLEYTDGV